MLLPVYENGQVHEGAVDVEARARPGSEPEDLREGHEVTLLDEEGAVAGVPVLASGWGPARGWDELQVGRLVALLLQDPLDV